MEDTIMNSIVPAAVEKPESKSNVKDEPQADVEVESELEGACFDVLDMVEEPFDDAPDNYYSSEEVEVDSNCEGSSESGSLNQSPEAAAADNSAADNQSAEADDDVDMEEVFETIDGDPNDYEECYVAERPPSPPDNPIPRGWKQVYHESGAAIFVHLETNVCSLSRPYFLGSNSTKFHKLPTTPVPCLRYKSYQQNKNEDVAKYAASFGASSSSTNNTIDPMAGNVIKATSPTKDVTAPTSNVTASDNNSTRAAPMDASDDNGTCAAPLDASNDNGTRTFPMDAETASAHNDTIVADTAKGEEAELLDYCKRLFKFKKIKYLKFRSWDVRRTYLRALRNERNRRRCPFSNNKFVSFPIESKDEDGNVVSTKKWIINPRGRSYVAILHEYLQQSKKTQPEYKFTEVDNARNPYAATVVVNGTEYGTGFGMSKKEAKFEAAKATLEVLLPKMMKYVLSVCCDKTGQKKFEDCSDDDDHQNVASAFDDIEIIDPRVTELSLQTTEPKPYELLLNCLQKKGEQSAVTFDFQSESMESTMAVGENQVTVKCANKREGKQLAAQAMLQQLHPHIQNWGSLLRLYGNYVTNQYRQVSDDKDVEELKTKPANKDLLDTLRRRMSRLSERIKESGKSPEK